MLGDNRKLITLDFLGSLHCTLAPLYTKKLNLSPGTEIFATHGGPRRGEISVVWDADRKRVLLRGRAVISEWYTTLPSGASDADYRYVVATGTMRTV